MAIQVKNPVKLSIKLPHRCASLAIIKQTHQRNQSRLLTRSLRPITSMCSMATTATSNTATKCMESPSTSLRTRWPSTIPSLTNWFLSTMTTRQLRWLMAITKIKTIRLSLGWRNNASAKSEANVSQLSHWPLVSTWRRASSLTIIPTPSNLRAYTWGSLRITSTQLRWMRATLRTPLEYTPRGTPEKPHFNLGHR